MAQTQKQQVIEFMRKNGSITQLDAYEIGYITRLSGIIYDLKYKDGYNIRTQMEQNPRTKKMYARYFLEK